MLLSELEKSPRVSRNFYECYKEINSQKKSKKHKETYHSAVAKARPKLQLEAAAPAYSEESTEHTKTTQEINATPKRKKNQFFIHW